MTVSCKDTSSWAIPIYIHTYIHTYMYMQIMIRARTCLAWHARKNARQISFLSWCTRVRLARNAVLSTVCMSMSVPFASFCSIVFSRYVRNSFGSIIPLRSVSISSAMVCVCVCMYSDDSLWHLMVYMYSIPIRMCVCVYVCNLDQPRRCGPCRSRLRCTVAPNHPVSARRTGIGTPF
jgi:hypothetical protein